MPGLSALQQVPQLKVRKTQATEFITVSQQPGLGMAVFFVVRVAIGAVTGAAGDGAAGDGATGDGATGDGATGDGATGDGATEIEAPVCALLSVERAAALDSTLAAQAARLCFCGTGLPPGVTSSLARPLLSAAGL